ncbi:unnamed protein product [Fraxinus pennsylvanica]|uniref:Subtilisin-like protease fibronectin type-III domain-containing protein n=1 Tax=Fraxinus pennsylvanica TaxID=56036 RepID=A0AAD1Z5T7_9LAMI|nr:unnamed protein product [Fraxinus pennsylvanica]
MVSLHMDRVIFDPMKAKSPRLVYDMGPNDYVKFLCGQGYSLKNPTFITGDNITCTQRNNVSTYTAVTVATIGLSINILQSVLSFKSIGQKQTFVVTVNAALTSSRLPVVLVWNDGMFQERSPVVAYATQNFKCYLNVYR